MWGVCWCVVCVWGVHACVWGCEPHYTGPRDVHSLQFLKLLVFKQTAVPTLPTRAVVLGRRLLLSKKVAVPVTRLRCA